MSDSASQEQPSPMTFAEAAECCGLLDHRVVEPCINCPLLIARRRDEALRDARAN